MKVIVYAIAKNEEKHVDRFMDSVKEADAVYVLDTGSTDSTVEKLQQRGAIVKITEVKPWRFDVARNLSLDMVPDDVDICVCIDLDEVFSPGWRKAVEESWVPSAEQKTTQLQYNYIWSHNPDNSASVSFWISKIHQRKNYIWEHPVHEIVTCVGEEPVVRKGQGFEVHHYPDKSKSRSSYLELLELAVKESPNNDRDSHYLGREYMLYKRNEEAIKELERHLTLPLSIWSEERAASMRFIARCNMRLNKLHTAKKWALKACAEAPLERETWWELANVAHAQKDFRLMYFAATTALMNGRQGERYIAEPSAWGYGPYDYAAVGANYIGFIEDAVNYGAAALDVAKKQREPDDVVARLVANLDQYRAKLEKIKAGEKQS